MSYQQEKNCVHLFELLNTFTVAVGWSRKWEVGGKKGTRRWGMQKKHRSKRTVAGEGSN